MKTLEKRHPSIYNLLWLVITNKRNNKGLFAAVNKVLTEETGNGII